MSSFALPDHLKQDLDFSRPETNQYKMKAEFEFDNYNQTKPQVISQAAKPVELLKLKITYLNTVCGVLRIILIVS
jgi:hypothetical protein